MKKSLLAATLALAGVFTLSSAEVLLEEDFAFAKPGSEMPKGFTYFYGSQLPKGEVSKTSWEIRKYQDGHEMVFNDQCDKTGIGLGSQFPVEAGAAYRVTAVGAVMPGRDCKNVYVQLVAGSARQAIPLDAPADGAEVTRQVEVEVPAGIRTASFHLYSQYDGQPGFIVRSVKIERTKDAPDVPVEIKLAEGGKVLLDEDFSKYEVKEGVPEGYKLFYAAKDKSITPDMRLGIVKGADGKNLLQLEDNCSKSGHGPYKDFPAVGGKKYRASVIARAMPGRDTKGCALQFNLARSKVLATGSKGKFALTTLEFEAPANDTTIRLYIYSNYNDSPAVEIQRIVLEELP